MTLKTIEGTFIAPKGKFALVVGRFNSFVVESLVSGAVDALVRHGVSESDITIIRAPGAFEIPFASKVLASSGRVDAVVCLGAVIRGETSHYDFVAGECARGIQEVQLATGVPVIFGVLTTEDDTQALARSEGPGGHNVGEECAFTAVEMALLAREVLGR